ncbi:2-C-methyl-D-erythritol 4-phosphate cytidylyltransferase [Bacillus sp. N9]
MNYQVIIPAAGSGNRMGAGYNKVFLKLDSRPVILHTLDVFGLDPACKQIILVIQRSERDAFAKLLQEVHYLPKIKFVDGGTERQYSVYNGLDAAHECEIILVHDGARPFIQSNIIENLVTAAAESGAAIAAVPVKDTIKRQSISK